MDAATTHVTSIELVYFDIHARGELTRLCFAAAGRLGELKDTRIPLFMESEDAAREWRDVHCPKSPCGYVPYLNVKQRTLNEEVSSQISGDGVVESFVARHLGLCGRDEVETGKCMDVATAAVSLLGPQLTRAGLNGQSQLVREMVQPDGAVGSVLVYLEAYIAELRTDGIDSKYLFGETLSVADLAVFNTVDECCNGPRSKSTLDGVEDIMRHNYGHLMRLYDAVKEDMCEYLSRRQELFDSAVQ